MSGNPGRVAVGVGLIVAAGVVVLVVGAVESRCRGNVGPCRGVLKAVLKRVFLAIPAINDVPYKS